MTNATKTLSTILILVVALTLGVKLSSHSSSSKAFRSSIVNVDTAMVNKVIINKPTKGKKVILKKNGADWKVSGATNTAYPADGRQVDQAINQLTHLQVKSVATRNPENYTRYKTDSTGTKVLLMNGDKQLAGLIIGAPQFVSRREFNSYVRPVNDKSVYAVNGFLGSSSSTDVNQWRDKGVWKLDKEQITGVDFQFPADSSYNIKRVKDNKWVSNGDTLKQSSVRSILNQFSPLRAEGFVDSLSASDFGKPLYAIQLHLKNGSQKTLRLKPLEGDSTAFEATASAYPYVFTLNKSTWENTVLKARKGLLK